MGAAHSTATRKAATTRPAVLPRLEAIPPAATTQPMISLRCRATPPAATILRWALMLGRFSRRAITISILGTLVLMLSPTPSALARWEHTQRRLSPTLGEQRFRA